MKTTPILYNRNQGDTEMLKMKRNGAKLACGAAVSALSMMLAGCAGFVTGPSAPVQLSYQGMQGIAMGGQQPIAGAAITIYAASNKGYGTASSVLESGITTTSQGTFTASFNCFAGQQVYATSVGGNPGGGTNAAATLMSAIGDCATISANGFFVDINEISTVATVTALSPFLTSPTAVGTSALNTAGLARAFVSVNKLANTAMGRPATLAGATVPVAEINTLADALASCVNTPGGTGTGTSCSALFGYATPPGGSAPGDTLAAMINIAKYPTNNAASICALATASAPFSPRLGSCSSLNDWTMSVIYGGTGATIVLNNPRTTAIDQSGNVWIANQSNSATGGVTVLAQTGAVAASFPASSNTSLKGTNAIAIDAVGNGWVATKNAVDSIVEITLPSTVGTPITSATLGQTNSILSPSALAFDPAGDLWVGNAPSSGSSLTELSDTGAYLQNIATGISVPDAIAIDPK